MRFVTDFLWRSPLGLRINAQDTAGVTQTEDWVKIRGDQLVARDGAYDVRITAELWETHFVDHVSLLVVDQPEDVEVFVDERFAREAPALAVHATRHAAASRACLGRDRPRRHRAGQPRGTGAISGTFERGAYQGVARGSFRRVRARRRDVSPRRGRSWLVAHGLVYPTDSSINVAIGQGTASQPRGLSLEAQDATGRWVVVAPDLGFPAGKNKTILIDLDASAAPASARAPAPAADQSRDLLGLAGCRRRRERCAARDACGSRRRAPICVIAGSRRRDRRKRDEPETPVYDRLANIAPRWRDLVGYYTRFGDVRELLAAVDDRYVIMNAGDELRLSFPRRHAPPAGLGARFRADRRRLGEGRRLQHRFSKTVLPLPSHGRADYEAASPTATLEDDPVYQAPSATTGRRIHTRFVDARARS